jgi:hypothetical protein
MLFLWLREEERGNDSAKENDTFRALSGHSDNTYLS